MDQENSRTPLARLDWLLESIDSLDIIYVAILSCNGVMLEVEAVLLNHFLRCDPNIIVGVVLN